MTVHLAPAPESKVRPSHFLAPFALAILIAAVLVVVVKVPGASDSHSALGSAHRTGPRLPHYWKVRAGDTLSQISSKTKVTVAQLEALNPNLDPGALVPGQRLLLRRQPPTAKPRPKPLGPQFWTVRPGESFGSIATKAHVDITKLQQLNPNLSSTTLQPGDRVRLR